MGIQESAGNGKALSILTGRAGGLVSSHGPFPSVFCINGRDSSFNRIGASVDSDLRRWRGKASEARQRWYAKA